MKGNQLLKSKWGTGVLVAVGLVGIALIGLTRILPRSAAAPEAEVTAEAVAQALEERLTGMLSATAGVGNCRVMVTMESGARYQYAADTTLSQSGDATSSAESLLWVETDSGPAGLLLTEICPTVRGVAVVCDGGGDSAVVSRVTDTVATVCSISTRRVCVMPKR